jgi:heme ABC exporter ATP-binding subunit CcmA
MLDANVHAEVEQPLLLTLDAVTKSYGPVRVLRDVNLSLRQGELVSILGPNGSGKSTLLALAAGLTKPSLGVVSFGGRDAVLARSQMGWLGHESLCYLDLTGRENLALAGRLFGVEPAAIANVIERFSLAAYLDRPFRTYSRGQRQRISLARALLHAPTMLLLDEPTTGLDPAGIAMLERTIHAELERKVAILMVTHDLAFVARCGGRSLHVARGRLTAQAEHA